MSLQGNPHICATCSKSYKRREHLQRHLNSHLANRPYRCHLCNATFTRTDLLTRHSQTCSAASEATTASRRRRACDRCARQKKACSLGQPCRACQSKATLCRYSSPTDTYSQNELVSVDETDEEAWGSINPLMQHIGSSDETANRNAITNGDTGFAQDLNLFLQGTLPDFPLSRTGNDTLDWLNFLGVSSSGLSAQGDHLDKSAGSRQFRFLYNFTSRTGLSSTFECGTHAQRQDVSISLSRYQIGTNIGEMTEDLGQIALAQQESSTSWLFDPLVTKIHDIVVRLKEVVMSKPRNSAINQTWTTTLEQQCLQFFSPSNIRTFLASYWAVWHPNVNFVHKPTFDPVQAKSSLLASMAVIGACVSPSPDHIEQARIWFDCVEEMVFSDEDFCLDLPALDNSTASIQSQKSRVQALQAAYIVCLYQNWEGSDSSRRRLRRYRFSTLVSILRDTNAENISGVTIKHVPISHFRWEEFVVQEELTRTFLWIFLLDTCFVIFNNLPPRMVIKELGMRMAFPESCFQAHSMEDCASAIHEWISRPSATNQVSLHEAIRVFCLKDVGPDLRHTLAGLGPLNLFVIISAIHVLIFQRMNSFGNDGNVGAIHNALCHWQAVWHIYLSEFSDRAPHAMVDSESPTLTFDDMWKRIGFIRHSYEFWLLANLIVERMMLKSAPEVGQDCATSLDKYDQNNMRQVNELIASFESTRIS